MFHLSFSSTLDQDCQDAASSSSESLHFMMEQERTTYCCYDYFNDASCSDDSTCTCSAIIDTSQLLHQETTTPADRMKLTDWCYTIVDRCRLQRETVAIAMNIVDRFVGGAHRASLVRFQDAKAAYGRTEYQLVTVTALYIAIKMNERTIFGSRDFANASRGMYSMEDIEDMELIIVRALSWRLCPPTSLQVAYRILLLMLSQDPHANIEPGTFDLLQQAVIVQTEISVRDYYFTTQRPSTVAAAAIMNAIESVCDWDLEYLTEALICVVGRFPFETPAVLLRARNRLLRLASGEDAGENLAAAVSEENGAPLLEEESHFFRDENGALDPGDYHSYHSLVRDIFEQTPSSPSSVICDDALDESSFASIY